jgi:ATP-dependent DNA helicase RecG
MTLDQLETWLQEPENEHLELKEAKRRFDFETLVKYCAALANEGGGRMVLGVSDRRPRRIVGTEAFKDLERTKAGLVERLHLRVDAEELAHLDGRVLIFTVPSRPLGLPIQYRGAYWMRAGESLTPMTPDRLQAVFAEGAPDFSAEICSAASQEHLDTEAVALFRQLWRQHSGNEALEALSDEQLLEDAELIQDGGVTYAALILLGTNRALGRHLALAEVIFEYRSHGAHVDYQQRKEYREGFFLFRDELWETINLRNDLRFYTDEGFVRSKIPSFNEDAVREAILNAVSHRDYREEGSIFVRQFPDKIEIVSPGGFPAGINPGNLLWKQKPRNRRIAETFARCGLIERSGQGANRIFEACILEGKLPPDFRDSDSYQVSMSLHGEIDPGFVRFLKRARKQAGPLDIRDLLVIDAIHRGEPVDPQLSSQIEPLCERGIVERRNGEPTLSKDILDLTVVNGLDKLPGESLS